MILMFHKTIVRGRRNDFVWYKVESSAVECKWDQIKRRN